MWTGGWRGESGGSFIHKYLIASLIHSPPSQVAAAADAFNAKQDALGVRLPAAFAEMSWARVTYMWADEDLGWSEMSRVLSRLQYGDFVRAMRRTIEVGRGKSGT